MQINKITNNVVNNIPKVSDIYTYNKTDKNEEKMINNKAEDKNMILVNSEKEIGSKIDIQA